MSIPFSEDPSSAELVEGVRAGDPRAESELYSRFGPRVWYLALRELRSRDRAEDVRSETILRVLVALREGRLRSADALPAFVLQTARNVMQEAWRASRRTVALEDSGLSEPAADTIFEDGLQRRALAQALDGLSERDQAVLRLYYYEELSREEIAERLGLMVARVRLVRSRALQRFRAAYAELTRR